MEIQEVLHRRTDLSTFLVHLTRDHDGQTAKERLEEIIEMRTLLASPMGMGKDHDDPKDPWAQTQRVVCFSETPLEHIWTFTEQIEGRQVKFEPYGVALPKFAGRKIGINPVWYIDTTPGRDWNIMNALNEIKANAETDTASDFHSHPIAQILPFIEQMGDWRRTTQIRKEFWWEREWRKVGDVYLGVVPHIYLCPEADFDYFVPRGTRENGKPEHESDWNRRKREYIDPHWSLERIISHLAGFPANQVTPFWND